MEHRTGVPLLPQDYFNLLLRSRATNSGASHWRPPPGRQEVSQDQAACEVEIASGSLAIKALGH